MERTDLRKVLALVQAFGPCPAILEAAAAVPPMRPLTPRLAAALISSEPYLEAAVTVATVVRDLALPDEDVALPPSPVDPDRLAAVATEWGVGRQVDDLLASLQRQAGAE